MALFPITGLAESAWPYCFLGSRLNGCRCQECELCRKELGGVQGESQTEEGASQAQRAKVWPTPGPSLPKEVRGPGPELLGAGKVVSRLPAPSSARRGRGRLTREQPAASWS